MAIGDSSADPFDAVIVGSGFGGSVMACRLAEKLNVCLLERGKTWPPGSFPRTPFQFSQALWDPSEGRYGLFDVWSFAGLGALVSSGLGGGSLIYANVLLEKDERWFAERQRDSISPWPISYEDLEPHYEAVRTVLAPVPYPENHRERTLKTRAFHAAAEARSGMCEMLVIASGASIVTSYRRVCRSRASTRPAIQKAATSSTRRFTIVNVGSVGASIGTVY